ncbi:MAG: tetratricopeptide repeat protein [Planctomycetia bacterium]
MSKSPWVVDVTEANFAVVAEKSREVPVVFDFWAEWCAPCKMLAPLLEKLADEYAGRFLLAKVDVDAAPRLAQQFNANSIPLVVALYQGRVASHFSGVQPEASVRRFLDQLCPTEAERLLLEAVQAEADDVAQARLLYEQVLELEPTHTGARAALAEMVLDDGDPAAAQSLVEGIGEGSDGYERAQNVRSRLQLADLGQQLGDVAELEAKAAADPTNLQVQLDLGQALAAGGDYERALETLVKIVERDRDFGAEHARPVMIKLFNMLGAADRLSNRYRTRLAGALF